MFHPLFAYPLLSGSTYFNHRSVAYDTYDAAVVLNKSHA